MLHAKLSLATRGPSTHEEAPVHHTARGRGGGGGPLPVRAQQPAARARIGVLASLPLPPLTRFSRKLQELGYIEGQNLRLDYRFAEGHDERYPDLAAELVALPVDVIVTWGTPAVLAAKHITKAIPIVMGAIGVIMILVGGRDVLDGSMTLGGLVMYLLFTGMLAMPLIQRS